MTAAVALHPKATTARRQSAAETCPVAALADEAADLVKAWHGLGDAIRPHRPRTWVGLASILGEPEPDAEEEISAQAVRTEIRERLEAIREFALHRRATSAKGAAFQALVLNLHLNDLLCAGLDLSPSPEQRGDMERSDHQVERGLVSILHYLATIGGDLPDHLVKHYMMAAHEQPSTSVDRTVAYFRRQA